MKIWKLTALTILILIFICKVESNDRTVLNTIKEHYMNTETGLIHAYPNQPGSQYLSESIGLYMEYLIVNKNKKAFNTLFHSFEKEFIVTKGKETFIKWQLEDKINTNALIDDARITAALLKASDIFNDPKYKYLTDKILVTIATNQKNEGTYADFFDWSLGKPASRITLSYLTNNFFKIFPDTRQTKELLILPKQAEVFFPEYYNIEEKSYVKSGTVHMIDQLLIASNRENIGHSSNLFNVWLIEEWKANHKLYGQYDRDTLQPSVSYESLSVYFYLREYFLLIKQRKLANEVMNRAEQIVEDPVDQNAHFFDYIHYQLMETR